MKRAPSLQRRLLLAASAFIALALVLAAVIIGFLLHRFVQGQIDQRLDTQIAFLASTLQRTASGALVLGGNADGPPFDRPSRGWYWQVNGPANVLRARALGDNTLETASLSLPPPPPPPPSPPPLGRDGPPPRPADGPGPNDQPLHYRLQSLVIDGMQVEIIATAPRDAALRPWRDAMIPLGLSLLALGAALVLAIVFQVRLGLRPLERLRDAVAEVRGGRRERLPEEQPAEIGPLVSELNALLAQNAGNLERARAHVANLAHGLKTPLATLSLALSAKSEGNSELLELVEMMERRVRHHLGRARAAALGGPVRARTLVAPAVAALGAVLDKIHAERAIDFSMDVASDIAVACEPQDFDEIAGNLLDNAFKWARRTVRVTALVEGRSAVLTVEDDGPGLPLDQIPQILRPGQRLDENAPGFGFGLSITRELVELYGGMLVLAPAPDHGLRVTLRLPLPIDPGK